MLTALDPFDPRLYEDPYPLYEELRRRDPVHRGLPASEREPRSWYVTRYRDAATVLSDSRFGRTAPGDIRSLPQNLAPCREFLDVTDDWMIFSDPPRHTRLRSAVRETFSSQAIQLLRPRVRTICNELIDGFIGKRQQIEFIEDFAYFVPIVVISEILGVPLSLRPQIRTWSRAVARALDIRKTSEARCAGSAAIIELKNALGDLLTHREHTPGEDLISSIARSEILRPSERVATCILLLFAGHETTVNLFGNGLFALLSHPSQWRRLCRQPTIAARCVEELLRFESPAQMTGRFAKTDLTLGNRRIAKGETVTCVIGAANRDPEVFREPQSLDIGRHPNPHLTFGRGLHYCLGSQLARLEAEVGLQQLALRLPTLRIAEGFSPKWRSTVTIRALEELNLTWDMIDENSRVRTERCSNY